MSPLDCFKICWTSLYYISDILYNGAVTMWAGTSNTLEEIFIYHIFKRDSAKNHMEVRLYSM